MNRTAVTFFISFSLPSQIAGSLAQMFTCEPCSFRPFIPAKSESAVRQFAFAAAGHAVFRTLPRATADLLLTYKYTVPAVNTTVNPHRINESWSCSGPGDLSGGPGPLLGRGGSRLRACC